jgi:hypothetical protein
MQRDNEFKRFLEFVRENFPNSYILKNTEELKLLFYRVHENFIVSEIIEKYLKHNYEGKRNFHIEFLINYKNNFNRLLLTVPLNDSQIIYFNMRAIIENLLKFLYSVDNKIDVQKVRKTSYRHIKEHLLKTNMCLKSLNTLFSYYAKYSNFVHDQKELYEKEIIYIEKILQNKTNYLLSLSENLLKIINCYYSLIFKTFNITQRMFSSSENLRLMKNLTPKRYNKLLSYIENT